MAFYYVKNGGTATGDGGRYASAQTGSFATIGVSGYYNDIVDAINNSTTSPAGGDSIRVSDAHTFTAAASNSVIGLLTSPSFDIICVDDANVDAYRTVEGTRGAESSGGAGGDDYSLSGKISIWGMSFDAMDDVAFGASAALPADINLYDCVLTVAGGGDKVTTTRDGTTVKLFDTEVALNHINAIMQIGNAARIDMNGGAVTTNTAGINNLFDTGFTAGGGEVNFKNVDLSAVTGNLIGNSGGAATTEDRMCITFDQCKLASGVVFSNEDFQLNGQQMLVTRSAATSALAEHQHFYKAYGGEVEDDTTIRRADDPAFEDSGTIISYKIATNALAVVSTPFVFKFPINRWAELSAGATDTLRFFVTSTAALTDRDIHIDVAYPDGTNKHEGNAAGSATSAAWTAVVDPLQAGSTLTTDSASDWRDGGSALAGQNEYQIDVSTSGDVGADSVPIVTVTVTKPSVTIQLASIYELN